MSVLDLKEFVEQSHLQLLLSCLVQISLDVVEVQEKNQQNHNAGETVCCTVTLYRNRLVCKDLCRGQCCSVKLVCDISHAEIGQSLAVDPRQEVDELKRMSVLTYQCRVQWAGE